MLDRLISFCHLSSLLLLFVINLLRDSGPVGQLLEKQSLSLLMITCPICISICMCIWIYICICICICIWAGRSTIGKTESFSADDHLPSLEHQLVWNILIIIVYILIIIANITFISEVILLWPELGMVLKIYHSWSKIPLIVIINININININKMIICRGVGWE